DRIVPLGRGFLAHRVTLALAQHHHQIAERARDLRRWTAALPFGAFGQPGEDALYVGRLLGELAAALVGDRESLARALAFHVGDGAFVGEQRERRIDDAGARGIGAL